MQSLIGVTNIERRRLTNELKNLKNKTKRIEARLNEDIKGLIENNAFRQKPKLEGILITVDGSNGAGKSTLVEKGIKLAFEYAGFKNYEVIKESKLSPVFLTPIREYAKKHQNYKDERDKEAAIGSIVTAGRRLEGRSRLINKLSEGKLIILDRYIWTTIASQLGAETTFEEAIAMVSGSYLLPDSSLILTSDPEVGRSRAAERSAQTGREMENAEEITKKVKGYKNLTDLINNNYPDYPLVRLDTTDKTKEEVANIFIDLILAKYIGATNTSKIKEFFSERYLQKGGQQEYKNSTQINGNN